jgi:hypothetical protein
MSAFGTKRTSEMRPLMSAQTSRALVRIGSKETGREGTEIETEAESCMPRNADDAS